jgi:hypothetical protein
VKSWPKLLFFICAKSTNSAFVKKFVGRRKESEMKRKITKSIMRKGENGKKIDARDKQRIENALKGRF